MTSVSHLAGMGGAVRPSAASPQPAASAAKAASPQFREAFTDFVGQTFFGELLKQMRASVDKPAFFHGGMGEDIFQSQLDQVLVERMTDASGSSFSGPMLELLMAKRG
jgi:Rod binding protein.